MSKKELYAAPETEVLNLALENAILELSGGDYPGTDPGDIENW